MKTIFTFLFLAPFCLFSQQNSWFEPGTNWTYNYGTFANSNQLQSNYGITETTFAGKTCAKMDTDNFSFLCSPVSPPYYFYESNDSIYFATEVDSTFRMVFDFNAQAGDSWLHVVPIEMNSTYQGFQVNVVAVNEVNIDGNNLKELVLSYTDPFMPPPLVEIYPEEISVLEFVGASTGFFVPLGKISACDNETDIKIQCFNSPSLEYINPEFGSCALSASADEPVELKIYPNPAREYIVIETPLENESSIRIIQVDGKTVLDKNIAPNTTRISLPEIGAGVYFVEILNEKNRYIGKLIVR